MPSKIYDLELERELQAVRESTGANRYDEVWEGVYVMSPMPNDEHQRIVGRLVRVLDEVIGDSNSGQVRPGVNVSDRVEDWRKNYRVPDVAVFLNDGSAINHDSFWLGGPDLVVEITSPGEEPEEKLDFYGKVGTRELLIIEREPWSIHQYALSEAELHVECAATPENDISIQLSTVPLTLTFLPGAEPPGINLAHDESGREWLI